LLVRFGLMVLQYIDPAADHCAPASVVIHWQLPRKPVIVHQQV